MAVSSMIRRRAKSSPAAISSPQAVAALALREAYRSGKPCAPVRDLLEANDIAAAYAVQELNTQQWLAQGRRLVGRKIGLTSVAVQKQLGVDQPDSGMLFADMAVCDGEPVPLGAVLQPKAEAEVAFVLGRDLDMAQPTVADVMRAIDYATIAIEIVGSRIANWDIRLVDTVADNASSGLFVLGNTPYALPGLDLRDCTMQMTRNGAPVSNGVGHACLGHPLNATLWLARTMAGVGRPLKTGDVVLSGALGPMVAAAPSDVFEARVEGLGSVRAVFAGASGSAT